MSPELALLILKYLRVLTYTLTHAPEIRLELQQLNDSISLMVAENRNPTPEENTALLEKLHRAHTALSVL